MVPIQQMVRLDSKANRLVLGIEDIALAYGIHLQHDKPTSGTPEIQA